MFKDVGEAYAVLSDEQKKERYDAGVDIDDLEGGGTQFLWFRQCQPWSFVRTNLEFCASQSHRRKSSNISRFAFLSVQAVAAGSRVA